ncbi:MAG TPA: hypothetical protein VF857_00585, partial [Spirochaetota bacterium]
LSARVFTFPTAPNSTIKSHNRESLRKKRTVNFNQSDCFASFMIYGDSIHICDNAGDLIFIGSSKNRAGTTKNEIDSYRQTIDQSDAPIITSVKSTAETKSIKITEKTKEMPSIHRNLRGILPLTFIQNNPATMK